MKSKSNGKQLNENNRYVIERMLNDDYKLVDIAKALDKDPRGIKYEIVNHRYLFIRANQRNKCGNQDNCQRTRLCENCLSGKCKHCSLMYCNELCDDFVKEPQCKRTLRFPYVCNACKKIKECSLPKYFYKSNKAHEEYKANISDSKKGTKFTELELANIDQIIKDGVSRGLSIDVIVNTNNLPISTASVYRLIDDNKLSVKNIDLKRKVKYRSRIKTKRNDYIPLNYNYLNNRRYEDYCNYLIDNPGVEVWQMDTVEGKKGKSAILTLLHQKSNLQLFFKIDNIDSYEVVKRIDSIKKTLGNDIFKKTFNVILTDNGREFKNPLAMETDTLTGEKLINIFYCESRRSDQKGKCEKNHEHFREIFPKGTDFDSIKQCEISYASRMVNNYPREMFDYKSPYDVSKVLLNEKVFELNNLKKTPLHLVKLKNFKKK